ncbi:MAG: ferrous iron transporter B [Halobacteriovoraceae bacterium]|nr:ferrous iron transporter B [Halobacteriovoraceae bacterium]
MSLLALVGLPNSGKSALFNALTKNRQRVANFPGITVEKKKGKTVYNEQPFEVVDLPGVYTLDAASLDEKVTRDYVLNKKKEEKADVFVIVVDSTNLRKSLYLALQIKELGQKFVVAMNMMDVAQKRGLKLDLDLLSESLGAKVVPTVAVDNQGLNELMQACLEEQKATSKTLNYKKSFESDIKDPEYIQNKLSEVENIIKHSVKTPISRDNFTEKLDSILLHPVFGLVILFAILLLTFQLLFAWADPFVGWIEGGFELVASGVDGLLPDGYLKNLVIDGIIAGVGGVMVFLPHICFLFILINLLEDFGYLGRAAFLLDYVMRKLGLPGKAVVPLLSSHACAIPGIMSARIMENPTERWVTMMVSPLTTCSARLPVYTLLIAAAIPNQTVFGFLGLPGLVLFALYALGIISSFVVAYVMKRTMVKRAPSHLMMELPGYRMPRLTNVLRSTFQKAMMFVKKAGTVIVVLSIIIWALVSFPNPPAGAEGHPINHSYAAKIGKTFEPIFRPMGFDWRLTTALIPSFGAREVLVSSLSTVMSVEASEEEGEEGLVQTLKDVVATEFSLATMFALMVWFVFSPQCISTFAVLRNETDGYKTPLMYGAYTLALAYIMSLLTYQLTAFLSA